METILHDSTNEHQLAKVAVYCCWSKNLEGSDTRLEHLIQGLRLLCKTLHIWHWQRDQQPSKPNAALELFGRASI